MRTYDNKFIRARMEKQVRRSVENRDAVVYDVNEEAGTCRVQIQGSTEFITVGIPKNLRTKPAWLRYGNAVRLIHRGGVNGHIEIADCGNTVPTLTAAAIVQPTDVDILFSGCLITPTNPESMNVSVAAGVIRISSEKHSIPANAAIAISAAPEEGHFRYDIIVAGVDLVFDYIVGTEDLASLPNVPPSHVLIGKVLVIGGATVIERRYIYGTYYDPAPAHIEASVDDQTATIAYIGVLAWMVPDPALTETPGQYVGYYDCKVLVTITDQYGAPILNSAGWTIKARVGNGTGKVYGLTTGDWVPHASPDYAVSTTDRTSASTYFWYRRGMLITDSTPIIELWVESNGLRASKSIRLYDEDGEVM